MIFHPVLIIIIGESTDNFYLEITAEYTWFCASYIINETVLFDINVFITSAWYVCWQMVSWRVTIFHVIARTTNFHPIIITWDNSKQKSLYWINCMFFISQNSWISRIFPINDMQIPPLPLQKWSDLHERCPLCWNKWNIIFSIFILWVMVDCVHSLQVCHLKN